MADYSDLESIDPLTAGYQFYELDPKTGQVIFKKGGDPLSTTPAAQRQGTTITPTDLQARIDSGEFDPLKDLYHDPELGPVPFVVEHPTGISPDFPEYQDYLVYTPRPVSPVEGARAQSRRIASQAQGHKGTRLASAASPRGTGRGTLLKGLGTLGESVEEIASRTLLAPLS